VENKRVAQVLSGGFRRGEEEGYRERVEESDYYAILCTYVGKWKK
jgi:hypothetical protein